MEEEQQQLPEELQDYSEIEVGDLLRRMRKHYGLTLLDVEDALRIREIQIEAIERGDTSNLPGRVYAIGFVRTYAEYLGLDGDKIVHLFKAQYMDTTPPSCELVFPVAASETKTPPAWVVFASILVVFIILLVWGYKTYNDQPREVRAVPEVPKEISTRLQVEAVPMPTDRDESFVTDSYAESYEEENSIQQKGIVLNILEKSWVEIRNADNEAVVSSVLSPGDQYFVPDSPGLTMSLGNAGGVEIILDGNALMPLGSLGDVQKNIPLDTSYLGTLEFNQEQTPMPDENLLETAAGIDDKEAAQDE